MTSLYGESKMSFFIRVTYGPTMGCHLTIHIFISLGAFLISIVQLFYCFYCSSVGAHVISRTEIESMDSRRTHLDRFCLVVDGSKAIFARALFFVHSIFAVWAVTCSTGNEVLWTLLLIQGLFLAETIYCIYKRRGQEPKWSVNAIISKFLRKL